MPEPPYYNSIPLDSERLDAAIEISAGQDAVILAIMKHYSDREFTPWQLHDILQEKGKKTLITSVRRSLTTLTVHRKKLIHTRHLKEERQGSPNSTWRYKPEIVQQDLFK